MLFQAKHFEQFFDEKSLKKGLGLFLKERVEAIALQPSSDLFFLVNGNEITIKTKGDKVLSYTCTCQNENGCAHLSAALFYLQKDNFSTSLKNTASHHIKKAEETYKRENTQILTRKKKDLIMVRNFIGRQTKQMYLHDILNILPPNTVLEKADVYDELFQDLIHEFLSWDKLNSKHIHKLHDKLVHFTERSTRDFQEERYQVLLGLVQLFISLFHLRFEGDESVLVTLFTKTCDELDVFFKKGLTNDQENLWRRALMYSVESNKNIETGVFNFLLPRWVSKAKDKQQIWQLGQILNKRHLKLHHSQRLDHLVVAQYVISIRESKLFKTPLPLLVENDKVELVIAKASLYFNTNNDKAAFKVLMDNYDDVKTNRSYYYQEYLDYLILEASKRQRHEIQIYYLRESFLNKLFILPEQLQHFLSLIPANKRESELNELLRALQKNPFNYSFDKVAVVLKEDKRWDELIKEIKKQKNKFLLLLEVLNHKLPEAQIEDLQLLAKHLIISILEKEFFPYQKNLIKQVEDYLMVLDSTILPEFMQGVLNGLLKQSQIYRFLKENYKLD